MQSIGKIIAAVLLASVLGTLNPTLAVDAVDANKNPPYAMILLIAALAGFAVWRVSARR